MMNCLPQLAHRYCSLFLIVGLYRPIATAAPEALAEPAIIDLNTPRSFPAISSAAEWKARAEQIREQVLVSCGLWPLPARVPLNAHVFGKIERDGYSIEKVYFQSYAGFYVAGNLY